MPRTKSKVCTVSGIKTSEKNFYVNHSAPDSLHPYHKGFDNFRRVTGASVEQCRKLVNLINN